MFLMSFHWRKFCLTSKELGKLSNLCEKHCVRHCHFAKACFFFSIFFFFNKSVIFLPLGGNERCLKLQVKIAGLERHWRLKLISLGNYKCKLSHAALSFSLFQNHHTTSETTPCRLLFRLTKLWKLIGVKKWLKIPDVGTTSSVSFLRSHSASDDIHVREKCGCWNAKDRSPIIFHYCQDL